MFRIAFFLVFLFISCSKTNHLENGQTLKVNLCVDPQTLDPRKARDLNTITLMHMLYEGLTRTSKEGTPELALACDMKVSEDGKQVQFSLRESRWSNGEKVSSYDFAESWKSILDPNFPTDIAYQLYVIQNARSAKLGEIGLDQVGIHTPDSSTLIVDLEQPVPYLLELFTMSCFYPIPREKIADLNWANDPETCIGNGPFQIRSWKHSDQIEVVKNPHYWQADKVALDSIQLFMFNPDTEMAMFESGKLDWAGSPLSTIPTSAICELKKTGQFRVNPFAATYFYRVNTADKVNGEKNVMSSSIFRKALAVALDRKSIAEHILQGGHKPAKSLVPPEMRLFEKQYFCDDHKERARLLLREAKIELNLKEIPPITISYGSNERNAAIAQAIQKQWEESLGIQVELEAVEPKTFFQKIAQKQYQLAAGSWTADFNDPINFLEVFKYKDASTNNTHWEDCKYIDLLNRSAVCRDPKERKIFLRAAERILMDQMPIIPIFHFALNHLQRDDFEDIVLSPLGQIDFRYAHKKVKR